VQRTITSSARIITSTSVTRDEENKRQLQRRDSAANDANNVKLGPKTSDNAAADVIECETRANESAAVEELSPSRTGARG
jgi:hypothetical protein